MVCEARSYTLQLPVGALPPGIDGRRWVQDWSEHHRTSGFFTSFCHESGKPALSCTHSWSASRGCSNACNLVFLHAHSPYGLLSPSYTILKKKRSGILSTVFEQPHLADQERFCIPGVCQHAWQGIIEQLPSLLPALWAHQPEKALDPIVHVTLSCEAKVMAPMLSQVWGSIAAIYDRHLWMRCYDSDLCRMLAWWPTQTPKLPIVCPIVWALSGSRHWAGCPCIRVSLHGIESHVLIVQSMVMVLCAMLSFLSGHDKVAGCVAKLLELPTHHLQGIGVYRSRHLFCANLQVRACIALQNLWTFETALQDVAIYGHLGYGEMSKVCKIVLLLVLDLHALCVRLYQQIESPATWQAAIQCRSIAALHENQTCATITLFTRSILVPLSPYFCATGS